MSLRRSDYLYDLPADRIAQSPSPERDHSRMLVLQRSGCQSAHHRFDEITDILKSGDLLVLNDTRVIPARLYGQKEGRWTRVEILLIRPLGGNSWKAMVRPGRRFPAGTPVILEGGGKLRVVEALPDGTRVVELDLPAPLWDYLARHGHTPLPPYIDPPDFSEEAFHRARYQTVYARSDGSVAAPTAGLHFTPAVLETLERKGIELARITLHVGPGTFKPVHEEDITRHVMDAEAFQIEPDEGVRIEAARRSGRRLLAVGTTVTRVLEAVALAHDGRIAAGAGFTELFIYPGFRFQVLGGLLTNFHLPGSTLLMLVSAFAGREWVLENYAAAIQAGYRFYSYGDCMLIL